MSKSPAFQFYPAEFLSDENVVLMSNQEIGCYIKLMCYCWRERSIPADIGKLARLCGEDGSAMQQLWIAIQPCFSSAIDDPSRLVHPRLEREREKQEEHRKERSESGKKGAEAKWRKASEVSGSANGLAIKEPLAKDGSSSSSSSSSSTSTSTSTSTSVVDKNTLSAPADVHAIFDHWRVRMNHQKSNLDDKRRKLIQKALKLGYSTDDLIAAIDGCAKSPFHMGQNDRSAVYDGLDLILRDASKIDGFIKQNSLPTQAGGPHAAHQPGLTGAAARIAAVGQAIRDLQSGAPVTSQASGGRDFLDTEDGNAGEILDHVPDPG